MLIMFSPPGAAWQPTMETMDKSNMAENPEKQTAWICRLDQYPFNDTKPIKTIQADSRRRDHVEPA